MDAAVNENKEILHKLLDNAGVMILYLDPHKNISFCNKRIEDLVGLPHSDIIGNNWLKILFGNSENNIKENMFKAILDDSIKYKRAKDFEVVIPDKEGNKKVISWSITPILTDNQRIEGNILFGQDVTEIREREASLRNIDETLKNILSSLTEYALYVINLEGKITYFGMGAESMLGWNKSDIIFKPVSVLHYQDFDGAKLHFILEHVRLFGKYETELELVSRNEVVVPTSLTVTQFLDANGKLSGYIFIAKDITERKKLEYQVIQSEKLVALGQLSAGMAHEINNPLFVISGRLELLLQEKLDHKVRENLVLINNQAIRIQQLVERILKFSRKTNPTLEPLNINETIEQVLPLINFSKLPAAKIKIEKNFDQAMPFIKGDLHQLQEVFVNLLMNAYQSMPGGGVIRIITSNFHNLYAQIQISDTGIGVAPEQLKNIFMPFFTTKKEGTGLGLSICHNIIKNHGGSIELESQINQGSTFTIKLPFI